MFKGSFVALVTPHRSDGSIDEKGFRELIEFQIQRGTHGIVPCGCTGEAATMTHDEQKRMIKIAVETVNKRVPVIAGAGSNNTVEAIDLTKFAKKSGADGALSITPYYNKPTPEGQYRHYASIAKAVDIPIMLYNVPSRTGISISPETVARLSEIDNIVAIKEASGSLDQVNQIISLCDIVVLSGDDSLTLPMMACGAKGVVSVAANIVPSDMANLVNYALNENFEEARSIHKRLTPLFKALFIETNPIPVKTALSLMNKIERQWRLPLCEMTSVNLQKLRQVLQDAELI
ncbi:MAG: 4-hydroxy-tetrahydrodipicolinate synthase [Candidatus Omnitrophica bacterium]|nr:4-hydroxy-tetrahydrodipicolinate synthase [Candidatus Omnitrophota bacterium]